MKKVILIVIIVSSISFTQSAGNSGLSFLKFGFGARNIAMGDAGSTASNDLSALFYNPSRLVSSAMKKFRVIKGDPTVVVQEDMNEVMFMHNEWIQDVRSEVGGIKWSMLNLPWAVGFNVTTVSDIEVREKPGEPISKFNANYFFGSLSSGFTVIEDLDFGATFKYLYEGLLKDESTGYGFDFGLNYFTPVKGLTASAVLKNVGSMSELRIEKTKLPSELRFGGAYNFGLETSKLDFIIAAEFQKYLDTDDIHINSGGEIVYDKTFAARAGYQSGYEARSFTGGIGIMWSNLRFDYAYMPFSLGLGNANLFSIQFKF